MTDLSCRLYIDTGSGYNEKESLNQPICESENKIEFELAGYEKINRLRFDLLIEPAKIEFYDISISCSGGAVHAGLSFEAKSLLGIESALLFDNPEPQLHITVPPGESPQKLNIHFNILFMGIDVCREIIFLQNRNVAWLQQQLAEASGNPASRESLIAFDHNPDEQPGYRTKQKAFPISSGPAQDIKKEYLKWYYNTNVWQNVTFLGVNCAKAVSDLWNYQEIITGLKPALVVEFGTHKGGGALFFSHVLNSLNLKSKVFTVDISHKNTHPQVKSDPRIEIMSRSSVSPEVKARLIALREEYPGPVFAILDSDHSKPHVLEELEIMRAWLQKGDYLVVEDGIVNNNPVLPGWGEGPLEAIEEYFRKNPDDYERDLSRENKFGFTFAPHGFLIRK